MTPGYIAPEVAEIRALHPYAASSEFLDLPIVEQISAQADTVLKAHQAGDVRIGMQVMCWWPAASGQELDAVMASDFGVDDARLTISREYGYPDWTAVLALGGLVPDPLFERALEAMLRGHLEEVISLIDEMPELTTQRSRYGHRATLLHYLAANGVESIRQRVPLNAVDLAKGLLSRGASKSAKADMYGGGQTPFALASTSAHPKNAGIADLLNRVLKPD
ncbi:MAG: hypothetical protein AAF367_19485 [Pseudomonadota bacterium]